MKTTRAWSIASDNELDAFEDRVQIGLHGGEQLRMLCVFFRGVEKTVGRDFVDSLQDLAGLVELFEPSRRSNSVG